MCKSDCGYNMINFLLLAPAGTLRVTHLIVLLYIYAIKKPVVATTSSRCLDRERLALLKFKDGLKHPTGGLHSWEHKKNCCKWKGILCDNHTNRVVELNLRDIELCPDYENSCGWIIPEALGNMESLSLLDLSFTTLKGRIPNSLGNLTSLVELHLSYNMLDGGIPDSFGKLTSLSHLDLSANILQGGIPVTLGNITSLSHLDLSTNMFEGSIPVALWTLSSLSYLNISSNKISGTSLDSFQTSGLSYLDMSHNQMSGPVPDLSTNFPELLTLDLSLNEFNGPIPLLPRHLQILNLSKNKISGNLNGIYSDHDSINRLALLDVSDNLLTGELPSCLDNLQSLQYLNLANNYLSGEIQDSILWPSTLDSLHLWSNSFRGEIPKSLRECSGLRYLVIGENYFTGKIPAWIGESLSELSFLSLTTNYFNGSLPSTLCHLQKLQVLDISSNNISGTIPSCFNNLTSMYSKPLLPPQITYSKSPLTYRALDPTRPFCNSALYSSCLPTPVPTIPKKYDRFKVVWKGNETEENHEILYILKLIDLSENKLVGEIPSEIAGLDGLIALNLSGNHLEGSIPPTIGNVELLNFLDLSRNNLIGCIPDTLSQLNHLGILNLSYNNLSGRIPWSNHLTTFNSYSFLGNPELCGLPLSHPCPGDDQKPAGKQNFTDDNVDEMDGDKYITKGFYVSMTFGVVVGFWCVLGTLILNRTCRFAYFRMPIVIKDWMYVKIVMCWKRWT
ncbi:receptor-like protein EIX2 isoform X3 [Henckelia pumila]|uniref:receptor-like protein EIX2 isoform X3 n=1 Tax=Henckelia pumila TaxID=405737 RepID=UPI003C6E920B